MAEPFVVAQPRSDESISLELSPDAPLRFGFDLSEATFAGSGNDLVISCAQGGCVVLRGYLALAVEGTLPTFEMLDGERVPGDFYLFAFEPGDLPDIELATEAGDAPQGAGSGEYSDDPGALGLGLDAVDGQNDLPSPSGVPLLPVQGIPPLDATPGRHGETSEPIFADQVDVQIVLNPGFEHPEHDEDWIYLDDAGHWHNAGEARPLEAPRFRGMRLFSLLAESAGRPPVKSWGAAPGRESAEGERFMELDARQGTVDTLTQAIATQAGGTVTVSFNFTPRMDGVDDHGMSTNDFKVTLGDRLVAAVTWDAASGAWLVTLGEGVTTADGSDRDFHFTNDGYIPGIDGTATDWTHLSFSLTADQDHADLSFHEYAARDDGFGALLDFVNVVRGFDILTEGADRDGVEFLAGTNGDDAIFGSPRGVVDGVEDAFSFAEVIDGGAGDDALYGGQNFLTVLSGGEGDDFIVAGRPVTFGMEESQDMDTGVGMNLILPGCGNDYIRLGDGDDAVILNREALVDGETLVVEGFAPGSGDLPADQIFLADGLSVLGPVTYEDGDLHLLVGDADATIEITLRGMSPTDLDLFLVTGAEADLLDAQVREIIDSGGASLV